jgi:transcriptional regulator with XRE-family HTH domain
MASKPSPPMLRRQLGAELRRLREQAGRTCADVAGELSWSESKLSRIETAHTGISNRDLDRLLQVYDLVEPARVRLRALVTQARQRAWWEAYGDVLPDAYETYIGFEAEARLLSTYQSLVVPGLLQTDEYAQGVIKADATSDDPGLVAQRVSVRLARSAVLTREPPLELRVVLDEAALRRSIGGHGVMRRQLLWLTEASERSNVELRVLPFSAGAHRGLAGSFTILDFPNDADSAVVYSEGMTGGVFRTRPDDLRSYAEAFEALQAAALDPAQSAEFLFAVVREVSD